MARYSISYEIPWTEYTEADTEEELEQAITDLTPPEYGGDGIHIVNQDTGEEWDE